MAAPAPASLTPGLRDALRGVRRVGVITGAGVSRASGIRTYRGRGGVYDDPDEGDATVDALSGPTLRRDPDRTWRALARMTRESLHARPNAAHEAIAAMERRAEGFVLLTQNVDGLHQAAGSRNVIDIHGSLTAVSCMQCGEAGRLDPATIAALVSGPRCPHCSGPLRPGAVLFGELLPLDKLARIEEELLADPPDLVLVAGTSALFPYIVEPVLAARRAGRLTVEVNVERTTLSGIVGHFVEAEAGVAVPAIEALLAG